MRLNTNPNEGLAHPKGTILDFYEGSIPLNCYIIILKNESRKLGIVRRLRQKGS